MIAEFMGAPFNLGDTIRGKRFAQGYRSQASFAKAVTEITGYEVTEAQLQGIESGRQRPSIYQYIAIALALGELTDPMLIDAVKVTDMYGNVMRHRIKNYLDSHASISVISDSEMENGNLLLKMSDGRQVEFSIRGKGVFEYGRSSVVLGDGWEAF